MLGSVLGFVLGSVLDCICSIECPEITSSSVTLGLMALSAMMIRDHVVLHTCRVYCIVTAPTSCMPWW